MGSRMYQDSITIEGGHPLYGEVRIHGAKNAVLPVLSASLLLPETILHQCPDLTDVTAACRILSHLGCGVKREGETLLLSAETVRNAVIPPILAGGMRGSVIFLGAMLSRFGSAEIALPGGCRLGARPVDIHLSGLEQMGALICEENGWLCCSAPNGLHGAKISLRYPSVGATENLLIAAALARGETVLYGAAMEPEIDCLIAFLNSAGAKICREGDRIFIEGVASLHETEHTIIPDRIEAVTYLCAVAAAGGEILLRNVRQTHLQAVLPVLEHMGCILRGSETEVMLCAPEKLRPVCRLITGPYPGFPTDALPPMMIPSLLAQGESHFTESVFSGRYLHAEQLRAMGANLEISGADAKVYGVFSLHGANLHCTDLRGGAALLIAALAAEGKSTLSEMQHIRRGYCVPIETLCALGCRIKETMGAVESQEKFKVFEK